MNKYTVVISEKAQQDLRDLSNTINFEYILVYILRIVTSSSITG